MDDQNNNDKKDFNDNETETKNVSYLSVGIALGAAVGVVLKNIWLRLAIGVGIDSQKSKKNDK